MSLPSMNLLREFPADYFVETGTYRGDSIQMAIDSGCFKNIIGLEYSYEMVRFCKDRFNLYFSPRPELRICEADTATDLNMNIAHIPQGKKITFFLDAHWQMFEGTDKGENPFPLLKELEQIAERRNNRIDTIIIDDFLYLTHPDVTGWTKKKIIEAVMKVNPHFTIKITSNPIVNNLLIAIP